MLNRIMHRLAEQSSDTMALIKQLQLICAAKQTKNTDSVLFLSIKYNSTLNFGLGVSSDKI